MASSSAPPIHGNYHGYYLKRPSVSDPRLAILPPDTFSGKAVLDVGCNEGWVSCEIAQTLGAKRVVGVDIDESLIRGAWRRRRTVWSLQGPPPSGGSMKRKRSESPETRGVESSGLPNHFPAALEHSLGPLPIPPARPETADIFPHNITFRVADWVVTSIPEDKEGYDVILGFSITKWIHLNSGDEGIRAFFGRVHSLLKSGGQFILEPQDWENYGRARRIDKKLKESMQTLTLRPDDFDTLLQNQGFSSPVHCGTPGEGGFKRPVLIYTKLS
ncbi:Bicoid-interacting protein 3-domain-containing protein [Flagelloscypha sp. PMI_526]|nr:Bicoid-interacting protein 3-domain-containing protein [Flagelloscypha sp. PMI_526]